MAEPIVEALARRPAPPLRPFIDRYVAYRLENVPPGIHRGLPSRHLTFIISLDEPIHVEGMPGARYAAGFFDGVVSGLHPGPAIIRHGGKQIGIAIEVTPLGARSLFGRPAAELVSTVVEAHEILRLTTGSLSDRLASAPSWRSRFAVLDALLAEGMHERRSLASEVEYAWRTLVSSDGAVPIRGLAEEVGWSRRHLSERFRREFGLAPKLVARILRFQLARTYLTSTINGGLAAVAQAAGYFDQAHFTREFTEFAGCPPTRWIAEELPSVQDNIQSSEDH